jgi:hypothetical protein
VEDLAVAQRELSDYGGEEGNPLAPGLEQRERGSREHDFERDAGHAGPGPDIQDPARLGRQDAEKEEAIENDVIDDPRRIR